MVSSEHIKITIPEDPDNPYRLGWKVNHDPRSADYSYQPRKAVQVVTRDAWPSPLSTLDQGSLGSCVPNTGVEWLATDHTLRSALREAAVNDVLSYGLDTPESAERLAVEMYRQVTARDPFDGQWEPDDTGSDGTSLGNLFVELGWAESFEHAFRGLSDVLNGLSEGSVWMGSNWYSSMFDVDSDGEVVITPGAWVAGGHQFLLTGAIDTLRQRVQMRNHWRPSWGDNGRAWLSYATIERLLGENGDAQIVRPKVVVSPPPFPPNPEPEKRGCLGQFSPASIGRLARSIWNP